MPLSAPQIVGPVSVCSKSVRVKGQLTGATVRIILNGNLAAPIAADTATWSDQVFQFTSLPAAGLLPGDKLTAVQELSGETSDQSPEPALIQSFAPDDLKHVNFVTHLYVCGRHLWLNGLVPGATVEVGPGGTRGRADSIDGNARLSINPAISTGENLIVRQVACGEVGPDNSGPLPDPTPNIAQRLPTPRIGNIPHACDRSVLVTKVVDGADVTLNRSAEPPATAGFDLDSLWFNLPSPPLKEGESLSVSQSMRRCEIGDSHQSSPPVVVLAADRVPPPRVASPLCAMSTAVLVSGLVPGSKVRILADGTELVVGEAPDPAFAFSVPPLVAGQKITAQQERCGFWSGKSPEVRVGSAPATITSPKIAVDPLYECATIVPVQNVHRGSWIRVFSTRQGQISNSTYVNTSQAAIRVSPALRAGDNIYVEQSGCGGSRVESPRVSVVPTPQLSPPTIVEPVEAGQGSIRIRNVVPGAVVEVYLNGHFQKAGDEGLSEVTAHLGTVLQLRDRLNVRQVLCNSATTLDPEREVIVVRPKPLPPVNLVPSGGRTEQRPTLSWSDPGAGDVGAADSFDVEFTVNGGSATSANVTATSYTVPADIPYNASIRWGVRGKNSSGVSGWSRASFSIKAPPVPDGPSKLYIYNCSSSLGAIHIWLADFTASTLTEKGTVTHHYESDDFPHGMCPAAGSIPLEVVLESGHQYQLVAVDTELIGCGVNDPTLPTCQKFLTPVFVADSTGAALNVYVGP